MPRVWVRSSRVKGGGYYRNQRSSRLHDNLKRADDFRAHVKKTHGTDVFTYRRAVANVHNRRANASFKIRSLEQRGALRTPKEEKHLKRHRATERRLNDPKNSEQLIKKEIKRITGTRHAGKGKTGRKVSSGMKRSKNTGRKR